MAAVTPRCPTTYSSTCPLTSCPTCTIITAATLSAASDLFVFASNLIQGASRDLFVFASNLIQGASRALSSVYASLPLVPYSLARFGVSGEMGLRQRLG